MKLLVIGLDGFGPDHWRKYMAGIGGFQVRTLHSPHPTSGPAWTSIYTGMTPEQHRVFHVWGRPDIDYNTHKDIKKDCVWNHLYPRGVTCDIVGMPITWPASTVKPRFVSGFWQGSLNYWYYPYSAKPPADYLRWSDAIWWCADRPKDLVGWGRKLDDVMTREEFLDQLLGCAKMYVSWYLSTHKPAELSMLGLTFFDRTLHMAVDFWKDPGVVDVIGEWARDFVLRLGAALEPEKMLVVSDHGFDPNEGHTNEGVLAAYGFDALEKPENEKWMTWDVAHLIAAVFNHELNAKAGPYQEVEYKILMDRLRRLGYVE